MEHVLPFAGIRAGDTASVGGKGASLGELTAAGIPVPPGCVVTTRAFTATLDDLDPDGARRRELEAAPADEHAAVERVAAPLRDLVAAAPLPDDVRAAIVAGYRRLGDDGADAPVAVRSSATSEDSAEASFAGLQDTYLWVSGADAVVEHVRRCWASLYAVESVTYRRRLGLPEDGLAMAVVLQEMVDAKVSGVMFTCSPQTGDRSVVAIEASWGLGSAMVSGEVTPDSWTVNKITGAIVAREVSPKTVRHRRADDGDGVVEEEVPVADRDRPCLPDERIRELAEIARTVERHYGTTQDIEWAMPEVDGAPGPVRILQSRPETVWSGRRKEPVAEPKQRPYDHVLGLLAGRRGGEGGGDR